MCICCLCFCGAVYLLDWVFVVLCICCTVCCVFVVLCICCTVSFDVFPLDAGLLARGQYSEGFKSIYHQTQHMCTNRWCY
jgi:hypothetical protein